MIDKLGLDRLKELKEYTYPVPIINSSNFERLCGLGLTIIRMLIDEEISKKERIRQRGA